MSIKVGLSLFIRDYLKHPLGKGGSLMDSRISDSYHLARIFLWSHKYSSYPTTGMVVVFMMIDSSSWGIVVMVL